MNSLMRMKVACLNELMTTLENLRSKIEEKSVQDVLGGEA